MEGKLGTLSPTSPLRVLTSSALHCLCGTVLYDDYSSKKNQAFDVPLLFESAAVCKIWLILAVSRDPDVS